MWPRTPAPKGLTNGRLDTRPPGPAAQSKSSPTTYSAATSLCPTQQRSDHSEKVMCKLTTCAPSIRRIWGRQHVPQTAAHPSSPRASTTNSCATQQQRARVGSALPPTQHLTPARRSPPAPPSHTRLGGTYLLWGVTFCSILTTGNRRCPQPRKVRVASVPLTSRSSITREVGGGRGPLPSALQETTHPAGLARKQSPLLFFGELPAAWRAPQEADSEKMAAAPAEAGERKGTGSSNPRTAPNPRHRRQYCPPLVCKDPLFLPGPSGADEVPFRSRMEADEHQSGLGSRRLHL